MTLELSGAILEAESKQKWAEPSKEIEDFDEPYHYEGQSCLVQRLQMASIR